MKSRFNFRVYLIPFLICFFLGFGIIVLAEGLLKNNFEENRSQIIQGLLFIVAFGLIILHQIKTKLVTIILKENSIEITDWFKKESTFKFSEITGFENRIEKGKFESFEYLYIVKNGKRIATISQTYHENYVELKSIVMQNLKNLGISKFGLISEIKEIVTLSYLNTN